LSAAAGGGLVDIQVVPLTDSDRDQLAGVISTGRSPLVVTPFQTYDIQSLNGFAARDGDLVVGMSTYAIEGFRCEIVTLDASTRDMA